MARIRLSPGVYRGSNTPSRTPARRAAAAVTPKVALTPAANPQEQHVQEIFQNPAEANAATAALRYWQSVNTPEATAGLFHNYVMPTTATDPVLARMQSDALLPENQRSPEVQAALEMLRQQATRTDFVDPALREAFNLSRGAALGETNPLVNAQHDILNQGLGSALQTALRNARMTSLAGGQLGGGQAFNQRPAIQNYLQSYGTGLANMQIDNSNRYAQLAGQVDNAQNTRQTEAIGNYNSAIGTRETFEAQRAADRLARYNTQLNQNTLNAYNFGQADIQRRADLMAGQLGAPYLGASSFQQGQAAATNARYTDAAIAALGRGGRSGSSSHRSSGGGRSPSFGTSTPNTEQFQNPT